MCCGLWTLCHTIQHRAVLIIFPLNLQTITITRMLSSGGEDKGNSYGTSVQNITPSTSPVLNRSCWTCQLSETVGHHLDADFSWKSHVEAITSKATQRLYLLKQLRRVGVPQAQMLHFYTAVIRPVLEYAAPVWNHLLTKTQIDQIEAIQRRALRIIYSYTSDMPYTSALHLQTGENTSHKNVFNQLYYTMRQISPAPIH